MTGLTRLRRAATGWASVIVAAAGISVLVDAQTPSQESAENQQSTEVPLFRSGVTLVTTDVVVRDENGVFVNNLTPEDFLIYEDEVEREAASLVLVYGGRVYEVLVPDQQPVQEGIILPKSRVVDDTAGRIFIIFVDDLHMRPGLTPKVRQLIDTIADTLVHEGDMFGIIASGVSPLSTDLTYDRDLLYAAADRLTGAGFNPEELIRAQQRGGTGLREVRWRAHLAFKTARETLKGLQEIKNRRKAFIYISAGYDFDPFAKLSFQREQAFMQASGMLESVAPDSAMDPIELIDRQGQVFSDNELHREIAELARMANRSNTTFHTLDPRGLVAGPDIEYNLPPRDWDRYVFRTQGSLRTIAHLTGGIALVNRNNFVAGLREIDEETGDYYVVGFYTNAPEDQVNRTRSLRIEVKRDDVRVRARNSYTFDRVTSLR